MSRMSLVVLSLALATGIAGCSGRKVAAVHGKVTLKDGTPVKGATVYFQNRATNTGASGVVDQDGTYRLTSVQPGDGAPPGTYRVMVYHPSPQDSSQAQKKDLFHLRYESPEKSGLEYTVKPGDNQYDLVLDKP